ncbi:hypothetical protein BDY21DRAFT_372560 [Lineolata rhizophorae]|uniref:Tafazzin family protein n=1 Tax=Lineolata rhizophorae TaxID=578093 RepID=A0A6A6NXK6_9PEZI|nr:hypothetical protein BDY21DRAFT_372560 [Lineolata rhizophorae]
MRPDEVPPPPPTGASLASRAASTLVMGLSGLLCRTFLFGACKVEVHGLDNFLKVLDERKNVNGREKGLLTISNHVSVYASRLDDPLMWGVLPLRYAMQPDSLRWGLGSFDLCFQNKLLSHFFSYGQVLPTHRLLYSPYGGIFQPAVTQAIRLLSRGPFPRPEPYDVALGLSPSHTTSPASSSSLPLHQITNSASDTPAEPIISDPFSSPSADVYDYTTYATCPRDPILFDAPTAPLHLNTRSHAWLHVFPEGRVHQHATRAMRYFRWGVARLLLEAEPAPDIVPIWIEGLDQVMPEDRKWPRFVPRAGAKVKVCFGDKVEGESVVGDLRGRWRDMVGKEIVRAGGAKGDVGEEAARLLPVGEIPPEYEALREGPEAVALREECAHRIRQHVLAMRKKEGWPDEDPKAGKAETWRVEGGKETGRMRDGSLVGDT